MLEALGYKLKTLGLQLRGGFFDAAENKTIILVGNVGSEMWGPFYADHEDWVEPNPLDTWTRAKLTPIAHDFDLEVVFPFDGPNYHPFQSWAMRAGRVFASPIGPLIHPEFGLWHAYRAAFFAKGDVSEPLLQPTDETSPCYVCMDQPCVKACPVHAFDNDGYDVYKCYDYLNSVDGAICVSYGCKSRLACPVGEQYRYNPTHGEFHMRKFLDLDTNINAV